jgi:hypothetical protein
MISLEIILILQLHNFLVSYVYYSFVYSVV